MKLINSATNLISLLIYPMILTWKYPTNYDHNSMISLILTILIVIYSNIFHPLKANKYFNLLYLVFSLAIAYLLKLQSYPHYLFILWLCELLLCLFIVNNSASTFIWNFFLPIFSSIVIIFPILHFLSAQIIINIILINFFSLLTTLTNNSHQIFISGFCLGIILLGLYLLHYLTNLAVVSYLGCFIAILIVKYLFHLKLSDYQLDIVRGIFSFLNYFI